MENNVKEFSGIVISGKDSDVIQSISSALKESGFETLVVDDENALMRTVKSEMPTLIILGYDLPEVNGISYIEKIRDNQEIRHIPIVTLIPRKSVNLIERCYFLGATDYIPLPFGIYELIGRVKTLVFYGTHKRELESQEILIQNKVTSLLEKTDNLNKALMNIIDYNSDNLDKRNYMYMKKFSESCVRLAILLGATVDFTNKIRLYAPIYDIGKIIIPESIMNKSGKLTPQEFEVVKIHVLNGQTLFQDYTMDPMLSNIIQYHHEKWNGSGYVKGLHGHDIPLEAQIVSLMDVYIALTTDKVYKNGFSHHEASNIIKDGSGMQFQPRLVQAFINIENWLEKLFCENIHV